MITRVVTELGEAEARPGLAKAVDYLVEGDGTEIGGLGSGGGGNAIDNVSRVGGNSTSVMRTRVDAGYKVAGEEALGVHNIGATGAREPWRRGEI